MRKRLLYGWSYMKESAYERFDLNVVSDKENPVFFGPCKHMNVCGWPPDLEQRLDVVQGLTLLACPSKILESPLAA